MPKHHRWRFVIGLLSCMAPSAADSHPHVWIDVVTRITVDGTKSATAIEEIWRFDDVYTSTLLQEFDGKRKSTQDFVATSMRNLAAYGYFMEVYAPGGAVLEEPTAASGEMDGNRLIMRFSRRLKSPVPLTGDGLTLRVFDPTFYIDMAHDPKKPVAFLGESTETCTARAREAKPSAQDRARAKAMDQYADPDHSLGRLFAQTISVQC